MLHVCPTDIIHAPAERVWHLVAAPQELAAWTDTRIIEAPDGELRAGDRLVLGAGIGHRMQVVFTVRDAVRPRRLDLHIRLPLGVTNDEVIEILPIAADACRVTFN
jgi:uncharacterized protein YndB with AHSA1/START domain